MAKSCEPQAEESIAVVVGISPVVNRHPCGIVGRELAGSRWWGDIVGIRSLVVAFGSIVGGGVGPVLGYGTLLVGLVGRAEVYCMEGSEGGLVSSLGNLGRLLRRRACRIGVVGRRSVR